MVKKKSKTISSLQYGLKYLKKYNGKLILAIFWSVLFVLIPMQVPVITGTLIDGLTINDKDKPILFYGVKIGETPAEIILFGFISLTIVAITYGIASFLRISLRSIVSRNFVFELQRALIRKLEFLSLDIHKKYGSGDLLNHTIVDTNNVRPFVEVTIIKSITNIFRISYPLIMLFFIDPFLALVAYSILPIHFFIIRNIQSRITNILKQQRNDKSRLTTLLKENLDGIETIQTSNAEEYSIEKITSQIDKIEDSQIKSQRDYGLMMGFAWGLTAIGIAITWWLGGLKVLDGDITLGQLVIFSGFLVFAYEPVRYFTRDIKEHRRGIIALNHIRQILETQSSIEEAENSTPLKILEGEIEFNNVSFSFGKDIDVLKNISIKIEPKKITAVVGKSGSGKSSILKLITRLYDPLKGQILIDKQDIKNISVSSLRSQIAVVPQSPMIFNGTIIENIKLANPTASEAEVKEACIKADALEFISNYENGLHTIIGKGDIHLSGGGIQRIAIARALLKKAKILVLDEPISAVDIVSRQSIMVTLNRLKKDVTIVIVAHNIDSTYGIDNIITIDNGMVIELFERNLFHHQLDGIFNNLHTINYNYYKENSPYNDNNKIMENKTSNLQQRLNTNSKKINNKFVDYQIIGRTPKKRRMDVVVIGKLVDPKLKIFIMSGQHGDEKLSRKATERLISNLIETKGKEFPDISIAILSNANPDGSFNNQRKTSENIDMNRDHLLLSSKENRLIHSFIRTWKPNLIIDVHTYPPSKEYLEKSNHVFYQDVFLDSPTNLGIRRRLDEDKLNSLIKDVQSAFNSFNYNCDRYILVDPDGKVRHSTNDIVDARNFFSLRYDIFTILIEGREPLTEEDQTIQSKRTVSAQYHALLSLIKWAENNTSFLIDNSNLVSYDVGDRIPIRFQFREPDKKYKINLENKLTKKIEEVDFSDYHYNLRITRRARLPYAYAIPSNKTKIINLLHRHGFISQRSTELELFQIQKYLVLSSKYRKFKASEKPYPPTQVKLMSIEEEDNLSNYEIFLTSQEGGYSLPFLLEPQSEYGLLRYKKLNLTLNSGDIYPIVKVIKYREIEKDPQNKETKDSETVKSNSVLPIKI
jgi:ABC-type multidrug transport system fused ATPase/permease subunit